MRKSTFRWVSQFSRENSFSMLSSLSTGSRSARFYLNSRWRIISDRNRGKVLTGHMHFRYYIRRNPASKRWIIFLEGGWYCFNERTCLLRWRNNGHLMSSRWWRESRHGESATEVSATFTFKIGFSLKSRQDYDFHIRIECSSSKRSKLGTW